MLGSYTEVQIGPNGDGLPTGELLHIETSPTAISATFQDRTVTFNADWLRDNCQCTQCRIVQTDERRFQPWSLPAAPTIAIAAVTDGELRITWSDSHISAYTPNTWARINGAMRRSIYTARLWTAGHELQRFDHNEVVNDLVTRREMFESFLRDGAVVATGSPTEPGTVIEFLKAIGLTLQDSSFGLIFDVKLDPAGYNVAFTAEYLPPHNDNAQYTHPPSGQVLAMLVNEAQGGESIVVDGWSILEHLNATDPSAIDVLCRVAVGHRQYSPETEGFSRNPVVTRDPHGRFSHLRFSNQLRQPLPFDHPDLAEWYRAFRLLGTMIADPANHVSFRLNAGDTLFVNGMRILHARREYQPDGPRHLQDVYFDVDDVVGNLARMTGEATNAMAHE